MNTFNPIECLYHQYSDARTQREFAEQIGQTEQAVSQWMSGKRAPSQLNLADISRKLNIQFFPNREKHDMFDHYETKEELTVSITDVDICIQCIEPGEEEKAAALLELAAKKLRNETPYKGGKYGRTYRL